MKVHTWIEYHGKFKEVSTIRSQQTHTLWGQWVWCKAKCSLHVAWLSIWTIQTSPQCLHMKVCNKKWYPTEPQQVSWQGSRGTHTHLKDRVCGYPDATNLIHAEYLHYPGKNWMIASESTHENEPSTLLSSEIEPSRHQKKGHTHTTIHSCCYAATPNIHKPTFRQHLTIHAYLTCFTHIHHTFMSFFWSVCACVCVCVRLIILCCTSQVPTKFNRLHHVNTKSFVRIPLLFSVPSSSCSPFSSSPSASSFGPPPPARTNVSKSNLAFFLDLFLFFVRPALILM